MWTRSPCRMWNAGPGIEPPKVQAAYGLPSPTETSVSCATRVKFHEFHPGAGGVVLGSRHVCGTFRGATSWPAPVPETTVPFIARCGVQWYAYVTSCVNVKDQDSPGPMFGESRAPPSTSLVTVWSVLSRLVQVTFVPFATVMVAGGN